MIINKITKLYDVNICEQSIQEHIDIQNEEGWNLVTIIDVKGWYRFFWEKEITE